LKETILAEIQEGGNWISKFFSKNYLTF